MCLTTVNYFHLCNDYIRFIMALATVYLHVYFYKEELKGDDDSYDNDDD